MYRARLCMLAVLLVPVSACNRSGNSGPGTIAQWPPGTSAPVPAPSPSSPDPKFDYDTTNGCADIIVYRVNKERSEVLVVQADVDKIGAKVGVSTFSLPTALLGLSVRVKMYPRPQKHIHLCTDFFDPDSDYPDEWTATEGKLTIERFRPDSKPEGMSQTYRAKVTLEDAVFRGPTGRTVKCPHTITLDTTVGWYPG